MKNRVKLYKFTKYILHTIAAQIRLSFNHLIKEPWYKHIHEYICVMRIRGNLEQDQLNLNPTTK